MSMEREGLLRRAPLFAELAVPQLEKVAKVARETQLKAGETLFDEGTTATSLFLVASGTIEILKINKPEVKYLVTELGPGSHLGEMPFVDGGSRAASAVAKTSTRLLEIGYDDLRALMQAYPEIGRTIYHSIARTLCSRIRQTTTELAAVLLA